MYLADNTELLLNEDEKLLLALRIEPIYREYILCIFYNTANGVYMMHNKRGGNEVFAFSRNFFDTRGIPTEGMKISDMIARGDFIEEYRRSFLTTEQVQDDTLSSLLQEVLEMDHSQPPQNSGGYDGFNAQYYFPKLEEKYSVKRAYMYCVTIGDSYRPLARLSNYLLRMYHVPDEYSFRRRHEAK